LQDFAAKLRLSSGLLSEGACDHNAVAQPAIVQTAQQAEAPRDRSQRGLLVPVLEPV